MKVMKCLTMTVMVAWVVRGQIDVHIIEHVLLDGNQSLDGVHHLVPSVGGELKNHVVPVVGKREKQ